MAARPSPSPEPAAGYRWALGPWWILSHLFVLSCVVAFVLLGRWQLSRLDARRTDNARVEARQAEPPAPVEAVVGPGATDGEVDAVVYRPVTATGTWRPDEQVLIRNHTYRGAPGFWVVTPLVLADGRAVAVNRGWVPIGAGEGPATAYAPPTGTVTVTGAVAASEVRERLGGTDGEGGVLATMARVDLGRLGRQVAEPLYPAYITLRGQEPAGGQLPLAVEPPALDEGPHLNYAGQWFIFATLTCIVYPLLLRRTARQRAGSDGSDHADPGDPPGGSPPRAAPEPDAAVVGAG